MSHKKLSAFGIFTTSRAAGDTTDALVKQGVPAADITVSPSESQALQQGTAILLTVQANTTIEIELAKEIIQQHGASDVTSTGESVLATQRMGLVPASDRIL